MNSPHISGIAWFTDRSNDQPKKIGIVLAWTEHSEWRAFIGAYDDPKVIVSVGGFFPLSEAKTIIHNFGEKTEILL
ncbi:MAG: hypothetical protein EXR20_02310 [Bacteroidetes bacterium]|jgi:hypothetical protein|nr:hypothetical protein [Bacteroidota bacterium]